MFSIFLVFGSYVAAKSLFVGSRIYGPLSALMPEFWWQHLFGMTLVAGVVGGMIAYRLRRESLEPSAIGLGPARWAREAAWAIAVTAIVIVIDELLLTSSSNSSSVGAWSAAVESGGWGRAGSLYAVGLMTGVQEELVYRGSLFAFLGKRWGTGPRARAAFVFVSAVIFASLHGLSGAVDYAVYALLGAVLASALVLSGSLRTVMAAHVMVNCILIMGWGRLLNLPRLR